MLLCLERFVRTGRWLFVLPASLLLAWILLAGDPLGALIASLLAVLYGAFALWQASEASLPRRAIGILLAVVLGLAIATVQLLPPHEFLRESTRWAGTRVARERLLPSGAGLGVWSSLAVRFCRTARARSRR